MSCAVSSSYLSLLPYYHNESKSDIQDHFIENLKNYNGSQIQSWEPFISAIPTFTKSDIPEMLKDTKEIPMRHLIMTIFNSKESGKHPGLESIFTAVIVIFALNLLGLGLTLVFYIYKRSAKVSYRLPWNRGKTTEASVLYKAVPVYTGGKDDVSLEEEISKQPAELDETNAVFPTGIKQQQSQSKQTSTGVYQQQSQSKQIRPAFPVLKVAGSTTSSVEWYYLTNSHLSSAISKEKYKHSHVSLTLCHWTTKKMKISVITVEGNIGAGKTTLLLQKLEQYLSMADKIKIKIVHEPVGPLQTYFGNDMKNPLQNFYQNPKKNSFIIQNYVLDIYQQRMEVLSAVAPMCKVIVMDRGLNSCLSPPWTNITSLTLGSYT